MALKGLISAAFSICVCASLARPQEAVPAPDASSSPTLIHRPVAANASTNETILLTVPRGTAVQVVLDKEERIQKVGQPVHGRVADPVYAFDRLVVPVGTEVRGQITQLEDDS